jgi:hypothetical protein
MAMKRHALVLLLVLGGLVLTLNGLHSLVFAEGCGCYMTNIRCSAGSYFRSVLSEPIAGEWDRIGGSGNNGGVGPLAIVNDYLVDTLSDGFNGNCGDPVNCPMGSNPVHLRTWDIVVKECRSDE